MADVDRCPTCNRPRDLVPIRQWGETEPIREVPVRCCGPVGSPPTDSDEHEHWPEPVKPRRTGWSPVRKRTAAGIAICALLTAGAVAFFALGRWGAGVAFTAVALAWATFIAQD